MGGPLILVGMMGAGKTTIGRALATQLDWPFRDADHELEVAHGHSIVEMFQQQGEADFRAKEAAWVNSLSHWKAIIATGGGMPAFHDNMNKLLSVGSVVYLQIDAVTAEERIIHSDRPLWQGQDSWTKLLEQRVLVYEKADFIVDTTGQSVTEIVNTIMDWFQSK